MAVQKIKTHILSNSFYFTNGCTIYFFTSTLIFNQELYQLCGENGIVKFCKLSRLRRAGHVIRQDDDDLSRRVLLSEPGGRRPQRETQAALGRWSGGGCGKAGM
jgi:hypothetical protein